MTTVFVLMAGLPGTGKSTLAAALARALDGIVLSKDIIRAALFPGELTDYTEEQDDVCFRILLDAAVYIAVHPPKGASERRYIFLDGRTFRKQSQIDNAIYAARQAGAQWRILHLSCAEEAALLRIADDHQNQHDAAGHSSRHPARNRDEHLYRKTKSEFEAIRYPKLEVDTDAPLLECVELCLPYLARDSSS